MFEETLGIRNGDRMESFTYKIHECLLGTSARFSQIALEFAKGLLDEPTTVRLCTAASSSGYKVIASLWLDPLPVGMVSAGQFLQPAKPLELRLVGPHHPTSSVALQLSAPYPSATDPRV